VHFHGRWSLEDEGLWWLEFGEIKLLFVSVLKIQLRSWSPGSRDCVTHPDNWNRQLFSDSNHELFYLYSSVLFCCHGST
jgi:hypothetical protein